MIITLAAVAAIKATTIAAIGFVAWGYWELELGGCTEPAGAKLSCSYGKFERAQAKLGNHQATAIDRAILAIAAAEKTTAAVVYTSLG